MLALLNSSILTAFGSYTYEHLNAELARSMIVSEGYTSYIGHEGTCAALSELLDMEILFNRAEYCQQPGAKAIIFKLNGRLQQGEVLSSKEDIERTGYILGLLTRIN